jgi:uncharacterized protein YhdP
VISEDLLTWDVMIERLILAEQTIELPVWPRLSLHPKTGALLTLNQIRLSDYDQWLSLLPAEWQQWWTYWKPQLWLNQLSLHWRADGQLDDIRGAIDQLSWQANQAAPGMTFRQVTFDYDPKQHLLAIIPQGNSDIRWHQQNGEVLKVEADPLILRVDPANVFSRWSLPSWRIKVGGVEASVMMHVDEVEQSQLQLVISAEELQQVLPLMPISLASKELQNWLALSRLRGKQAKAQIAFNGSLGDLLTGHLNQQNFSAKVEARQVHLIYDVDYPPLSQADMKITWHPDRLAMTADTASLLGAKLTRVSADILYEQQDKVALRINGLVQGELPQISQFLSKSPLAKDLGLTDLISDMQLSGAFTGQLSLWMPLQGYASHIEPRVRGVVNTQKAQLNYLDEVVSEIKTQLLVSDMGVEATSMTGVWRHGALQARLTSDSKDQQRLLVKATTPLTLKEIANGQLAWRADVKFLPDEQVQFQGSADNKSIQWSYPWTELMTQDESSTWQVKGQWHQQQLKLSVKDQKWQVRTQLARLASEWQLINLSFFPLQTKQLGDQSSVQMDLPRLSGDDWMAWWGRYRAQSDASMLKLPEKGRVNVDQIALMGQTFNSVVLEWRQQALDKGLLKIGSPQVSGELSWQSSDIKLHLNHLLFKHQILSFAEKQAAGQPTCETPSHAVWPKMAVSIDRVQLETWRESERVSTELTDIKAQIMQKAATRSVKNVEFSSKTLKGKLEWDWDVANQVSSLWIQARAEQAVDLTRIFGIDNAISSGSMDVTSLQSWPGGLDCYDNRLISGSLDVRADDGVLSEASPGGLSRLLGLLSFDAFTRRLKIGLGDVVNQGLAFDKILIKSMLNRGVLQVNSLKLTSSALNIDLSGTTNLIDETHDLKAKVTPLIGDSIPTMALLSGASPITAIGYYLLQKIIPPLGGNFITLDYRITGTWKEPILDEGSP